jgi:hypothetical protein
VTRRADLVMEESSDSREMWMWIGIAAGIAVGVTGVIYLMRHTDAPHRLEKLLKRCEDRIHNIESSLSGLESSLGAAHS